MTRQGLALLALVFATLVSRSPDARAQLCTGPYRVATADGRCVWSCGAGTRPDQASNTCICQPGHTPRGRDRFGRLTCARSGNASGQPPLTIMPTPPSRLTPLPLPQPAPREQASNLAGQNPFNTRPTNLCRIFARPDNPPPFPYRCSIAHQHPVQFTLAQRLEIVVHKDRPLSADIVRTGIYNLQFRRPGTPGPNPDCNERAIGVPGACVPECARLEYFTFFDDGTLRSVQRANVSARAVCDRDFTGAYTIENPGKALAYDACSEKAVDRNLARWDHQVLIRLPKRIAAAFGFEDNHTSGGGNNWRFHQQVQHRFVYEDASLPVIVNCRQ